jgi:hypothetical protein
MENGFLIDFQKMSSRINKDVIEEIVEKNEIKEI